MGQIMIGCDNQMKTSFCKMKVKLHIFTEVVFGDGTAPRKQLVRRCE